MSSKMLAWFVAATTALSSPTAVPATDCNCPGTTEINHYPKPACVNYYDTQWRLVEAGRCHLTEVCPLPQKPCHFTVVWTLYFNSPPCSQVETVLNGWDSATVNVGNQSEITVGRHAYPSCAQGAIVDLNVDGMNVCSVELDCGLCPG